MEKPKENILLFIDDEEVIIDVLGKCARLFGYTAYGFTKASDALRWYRQNSRRVNVVCLDMKMPEMSGHQCFREIRKINSTQRTVLMSGFTDKTGVTEMLKEGAEYFFEKPFEIEGFFGWIDSALENEPRGDGERTVRTIQGKAPKRMNKPAA
ncbi:response regulator [bacterium]|nr:response regulator [bacterium]